MQCNFEFEMLVLFYQQNVLGLGLKIYLSSNTHS